MTAVKFCVQKQKYKLNVRLQMIFQDRVDGKKKSEWIDDTKAK